MDCRIAPTWSAAGRLHPGQAAVGTEGVDPLPAQPGRGAQPGGQPDTEVAGGSQHQAGVCGHRRAGRFGAALAEGETDPKALAELARGRLREKLGRQLHHLEHLEAEIEELDAEVARRLTHFETTVAALDTIPGVGRRTAQVIAAEVGTDMKRFPTPGHLASWAGVCPGNRRSGDRRQRAPTRKGNRWLKPAPRFHEGRLWWRRPRPPDGPRPIREPSTGASPGASGPSGRRWPGPQHRRNHPPRDPGRAAFRGPGAQLLCGAGQGRTHSLGGAPTGNFGSQSHPPTRLNTLFSG